MNDKTGDDQKDNIILTRSKKRKIDEEDMEKKMDIIVQSVRLSIYKNIYTDVLSRSITRRFEIEKYLRKILKVLKKKENTLKEKLLFVDDKDLAKLSKKELEDVAKLGGAGIAHEIFGEIMNEIALGLKESKKFDLISYLEGKIEEITNVITDKESNKIEMIVREKTNKRRKNLKKNIKWEEDEDEDEDASDVDEYGNIQGLIDYDFDDAMSESCVDGSSDSDSGILHENYDVYGEEDDEYEEDEYGDEYEEEDDYDNLDIKYLKYKHDNNQRAVRKDILYFKNLEVKDKSKILDLLEKIKDINLNNKPQVFRAMESKMPIKVKAEILKKLELSEKDGTGSEGYKLMSWIEGALSVPFGINIEEKVSKDSKLKEIQKYLKNALNVLDSSIYGHQAAKNKILQVIAQNVSNPNSEGIVMGIQGPMGNGKTTLIEEGVSKAIGRPFAHIPLGGATDASFLEGHSYTYEGSQWGKIVDVLIKCKCMNPIIYFDELDKVSSTPKGDEIINVLMHLIDPSQNKYFQDKYFVGIDFDLSKAIFVFSYNDSSLINPILQDRIMEINTRGFKTSSKIKTLV